MDNKLKRVWLGGKAYLVNDEQFARLHAPYTQPGQNPNPEEWPEECKSETKALAYLEKEGVTPEGEAKGKAKNKTTK